MRPGQIIQWDVLVQGVLILLIIVGLWIGIADRGTSVGLPAGILSFLLLLLWQFFIGIYIGAEYGMRHRSWFQIGVFCLIVFGLLISALGIPAALGMVALLMPVIMFAYFLICCQDLYKIVQSRKEKNWGDDQLLDSGDIF